MRRVSARPKRRKNAKALFSPEPARMVRLIENQDELRTTRPNLPLVNEPMRTAPPSIPPIAWAGLVLGIGTASALVGMFAGPWGFLVAFGAAVFTVAALMYRSAGRWRVRRAALATPFPEAWRTVLQQWSDHYNRLSEALQSRFEDDVRIFLAEKPITGVGVDVCDEHRLLVAASAVTLSLGWPTFDWEQLNEVLLYPLDFDRDYEFGGDDLSGQAHP
jgi:hypothetical protein